eukprot:g19960.t1
MMQWLKKSLVEAHATLHRPHCSLHSFVGADILTAFVVTRMEFAFTVCVSVAYAIFFVAYVLALSVFVRRWTIFPISGLEPGLAALGFLFLCPQTLLLMVELLATGVPCQVSLLYGILRAVFMLVWLARMLVICFRFEMGRELALIHQGALRSNDAWLIFHRWQVKPCWLLLVAVLLLAPYLAAYLFTLLQLLPHSPSPPATCTELSGHAPPLLAAFSLAYLLVPAQVLVLLAWRLQLSHAHLSDGFGVKRELLITSHTVWLFALLETILQYARPDLYQRYPIGYILEVLAWAVLVVFSLLLPVRRTFDTMREVKSVLGHYEAFLNTLRHSEDFLAAFYAFLEGEFATENLLFVQEAARLVALSKASGAHTPNTPDQHATQPRGSDATTVVSSRASETFASPRSSEGTLTISPRVSHASLPRPSSLPSSLPNHASLPRPSSLQLPEQCVQCPSNNNNNNKNNNNNNNDNNNTNSNSNSNSSSNNNNNNNNNNNRSSELGKSDQKVEDKLDIGSDNRASKDKDSSLMVPFGSLINFPAFPSQQPAQPEPSPRAIVDTAGQAQAALPCEVARELVDNYVRHGAPMEVNLPSRLRKDLLQSVDRKEEHAQHQLDIKLWNRAIDDICRLLFLGPLQRFRKSPQYSEWRVLAISRGTGSRASGSVMSAFPSPCASSRSVVSALPSPHPSPRGTRVSFDSAASTNIALGRYEGAPTWERESSSAAVVRSSSSYNSYAERVSEPRSSNSSGSPSSRQRPRLTAKMAWLLGAPNPQHPQNESLVVSGIQGLPRGSAGLLQAPRGSYEQTTMPRMSAKAAWLLGPLTLQHDGSGLAGLPRGSAGFMPRGSEQSSAFSLPRGSDQSAISFGSHLNLPSMYPSPRESPQTSPRGLPEAAAEAAKPFPGLPDELAANRSTMLTRALAAWRRDLGQQRAQQQEEVRAAAEEVAAKAHSIATSQLQDQAVLSLAEQGIEASAIAKSKLADVAQGGSASRLFTLAIQSFPEPADQDKPEEHSPEQAGPRQPALQEPQLELVIEVSPPISPPVSPPVSPPRLHDAAQTAHTPLPPAAAPASERQLPHETRYNSVHVTFSPFRTVPGMVTSFSHPLLASLAEARVNFKPAKEQDPGIQGSLVEACANTDNSTSSVQVKKKPSSHKQSASWP